MPGWEFSWPGTLQMDHVAEDYGYASGETGAAQLLDQHPELDAIFAAADLLCFGAMATLRARRLSVPERVGLVSFDDSPPNQNSDPPLTSVRQPVEQLGAEMVHLLSQLVDAAEPGSPLTSVLTTELIARESSAGPR